MGYSKVSLVESLMQSTGQISWQIPQMVQDQGSIEYSWPLVRIAFSGQNNLQASQDTHREFIVNSIIMLLLYDKN